MMCNSAISPSLSHSTSRPLDLSCDLSQQAMDAQELMERRDAWLRFVDTLTSFNFNAREFDPMTTGKHESPYVAMAPNKSLREFVWDSSADAKTIERYLSMSRSSDSLSSMAPRHGKRISAQGAPASTASTRRRSLRAHPLAEEPSSPVSPHSSAYRHGSDSCSPREGSSPLAGTSTMRLPPRAQPFVHLTQIDRECVCVFD